jgi:hypothetical protein
VSEGVREYDLARSASPRHILVNWYLKKNIYLETIKYKCNNL